MYLEAEPWGNILIKYTESYYRKRGEEDIVKWHVPIIISRLSREWSIGLKPKQSKPKCDVLVEEIAYLYPRKKNDARQQGINVFVHLLPNYPHPQTNY